MILVVAFAGLGLRVVQLQVVSADRYRALALDQRLRTVPIAAARGSIFDRNGRDLAISVERPSVFADPTLVGDPAMYASRLAPIVGADQATLLRRLSMRDRRFVYLARTVEQATADQVRALGLPGVGFVGEPLRQYPAGTVAAAVVGHVGGEGYGLDGLEALYDEELTGTPGELVVERDQDGRDIPDTERRRIPARRGTDLVLTLDQTLQYQVERTLLDQVVATTAKGGMAVVVDIRSGDILAMATVDGPPATGAGRPARAGERNRPLTDLYEPGSTNKVITVATALELGLVGPYTEFDVPAQYVFGDHTYKDEHRLHAMERWSVSDIVRESSNVGTIKIAEHVGKQNLAAAFKSFGYAEPTAVDFPAHPAGQILDPDEYWATGLASSAIGYSVAVTALHMVGVYTTVANDGVAVPPRLLDATIDADGTRRRVMPPDAPRVLSTATAQTMTEMLADVVRAGTGACAAIPGYTVAGKTGTSRKALPEGGYSETYNASFVGFAPVEAPRFAAIVVLDEPVPIFGGRAAAPVFAEVMQAALNKYRVGPTDVDDDRQYDAARAYADGQQMSCAVPHGEDLERAVAEREAAAAVAAPTQAADEAPVAGAVPPDTLPADTIQD